MKPPKKIAQIAQNFAIITLPLFGYVRLLCRSAPTAAANLRSTK